MRLPPPDRLRPGHRRDEGVASTVYALLMSSLVVVGMLAFVVDIGQIYVEREELQNGADAGALAAARNCAQDGTCTLAAFEEAARNAAEQNAGDGAAEAALRCARVDGASTGSCPLDDTQLTRCVGPAPADGNFVEIRTRTRTADGDTLFPPVFGALVLGPSYQGGQAAACARASWGTLAAHPSAFGFGIAQCAFDALTSNPPPAGSWFVPADQIKAGTPDSAYEARMRQRGCTPPAPAAPGALAWLGPSGGDCFQRLEVGADVPGTEITPDWSPPSCRVGDGTVTLEAFLARNRQPLPLPVYDPPSGGSPAYRIRGFAYFLPTGYQEDCEGTGAAPPDPCLVGFFTEGTVVGTVGTGQGYGLRAIQLIG